VISRLVVLCSPDAPALSDEHLKRIRALPLAIGEPTWLAAGEACEFPYDVFFAPSERRARQEAVRAQIRAALSKLPVDVALVSFDSEGTRRKKLLLADMDSTLIEQECIDELAQLHGVGDEVKEITARAMRGELEFESALRRRVALLRGMPSASIEQLLRDRISFVAGARTLVATMKANGAYTALVSGGFLPFTSFVAKTLQMNEHRANVLIIENGVLTGDVGDPILGKDAKVRALHEIVQQRGLAATDCLAVGDGANDIPMLQAAAMGVAIHAKPAVQAAADYPINCGDLTALLYLQGYHRDEFVNQA
jgi:phosphoserine phosphatase